MYYILDFYEPLIFNTPTVLLNMNDRIFDNIDNRQNKLINQQMTKIENTNKFEKKP